MNLNNPATLRNLDAVDWDDIHNWAKQYLPAPSAKAFATWIDEHLDDYGNEHITIGDVLAGAHQEWVGHDYPSP